MAGQAHITAELPKNCRYWISNWEFSPSDRQCLCGFRGDALIDRSTLFDLCEAFYQLQAPTRLKIRAETLSGTVEALQSGQADIALGVALEGSWPDIHIAPLGSVDFVYAVAPHHPLATAVHALNDDDLRAHRSVAVADSTRRGHGVSHNLLPGQTVLTVPSMQHKLEAQLRGLGAGFLPLPLARSDIEAGRLVVKTLQQPARTVRVAYAWRLPRSSSTTGQAVQWWLQQLQSPTTRAALLESQ